MPLLGDFSAFATATERLAQDPFQFVDRAGKDDWNFQLKSNPSEGANPYDTIPELSRNEYGLENLQDLYNAYRRIERGLPPFEESKHQLQKTVTICGLEIKYAKPCGVPESDSELTDSDFESDFDNSAVMEHEAERNGDNWIADTENTVLKAPQEHEPDIHEEKANADSIADENSRQEKEHCRHGNVDADNPETSRPIDHKEQDSESSRDGDVSSALVYDYASTVSPASRRVSRISTVGIARSRRCSVNVGVQSESVSKDLLPDEAALRAARRKSSIGIHERRKSIADATDTALGFSGTRCSRNGVFICQVAGRKFELVVEHCSNAGDGGKGVQCSVADIDAAMDVLFADLPETSKDPAKNGRVDVAIQWTGTDDAELLENGECEGIVDNMSELQSQAAAIKKPLKEPQRMSIAAYSRKSAPANLEIQGKTMSRDIDADLDGTNCVAECDVEITRGVGQKVAVPSVNLAPTQDAYSMEESNSPQQMGMNGRDHGNGAVEGDGGAPPEQELASVEVRGLRHDQCLDAQPILPTNGHAEDAIFPAVVSNVELDEPQEGDPHPNAVDMVPMLCEDDEDDIDQDYSFSAALDDTPVEVGEVVDVNLVSPSLTETKQAVDIPSSAPIQRSTVVIEGGVDIKPDETIAAQAGTGVKESKKRKRGKQPRKTATGAGRKGARAGGTGKRGTSHRELKRLGLTSVHVPRTEEVQEDGIHGSKLRRSKRRKFPPLQYWKNEKKIYERRVSQLLPTISQVVVAVEHNSEGESEISWGSIKERNFVSSRR